jgi:hypothetical protein
MAEAKREYDQSEADSVVSMCKAAIAGQIDLLLVCRRIVASQFDIGDIPDSILDTFSCVASELDVVPDERAAKRWQADALKTRLAEKDAYLDVMKPILLRSLGELLRLLEEASVSKPETTE